MMAVQQRSLRHLAVLLVVLVYGVESDKVKRLENKVRILEANVYHETSALRDDLDTVMETINKTQQICLDRVTNGCVNGVTKITRPNGKTEDLNNMVGVVKRAFGSEKARIAEHIQDVAGDMRVLNGTLNAGVNWLSNKLDDAHAKLETSLSSVEKNILGMQSDILRLDQSVGLVNKIIKNSETVCNENKNMNAIQLEKLDRVLNEIQKLSHNQIIIGSKFEALHSQSKFLSRFALKQFNISRFGSSYYFLLYEKHNWTDAQQMCESYGGFLAEVNSEGEHKFIIGMIDDDKDISSTSLFWLGANDMESEGKWSWVYSNTPFTVTYWRKESNEPNGNTKENCLHMYPSSVKHEWNDRSCSQAILAICEKSV